MELYLEREQGKESKKRSTSEGTVLEDTAGII